MMKPWEFEINEFADLQPFFDLLQEWGHPNVNVVSKLIENSRFPKKQKTTKIQENRFLASIPVHWYWRVLSVVYLNSGKRNNHYLPMGSLMWVSFGTLRFSSATEAIWAVVNAGKYK